MEIITEEKQKENILLDLEVSKLIWNLNDLRAARYSYTEQKQYMELLEIIKIQLEKQKNEDFKRYEYNLNRIPELKDEVLRKKAASVFYPKLTQEEKKFLSSNGYDYEKGHNTLFYLG
jgi:glucosamine 6-phosphate synthetase-like amidotransferase/phosphosugar isomerase protein